MNYNINFVYAVDKWDSKRALFQVEKLDQMAIALMTR